MKSPKTMWEFPRIGDPNIVPQLVGSFSCGPQNKAPLRFENSDVVIMKTPKEASGAGRFTWTRAPQVGKICRPPKP